jgi:hypothetical protein
MSNRTTAKLTANTVSWWIKSLIRLAYTSASAEMLQLHQIPPGEPDLFRAMHEIHAISSSYHGAMVPSHFVILWAPATGNIILCFWTIIYVTFQHLGTISWS